MLSRPPNPIKENIHINVDVLCYTEGFQVRGELICHLTSITKESNLSFWGGVINAGYQLLLRLYFFGFLEPNLSFIVSFNYASFIFISWYLFHLWLQNIKVAWKLDMPTWSKDICEKLKFSTACYS